MLLRLYPAISFAVTKIQRSSATVDNVGEVEVEVLYRDKFAILVSMRLPESEEY
jgi:hypothetical protein